MQTRDQLTVGGLRAYEVGRIKAAARAGLYLVPLALLCALETGAGETCACLGVLLLGASVFLRWRDRRGVDSVTRGLLAGSATLFTALIVARVAPSCAGASPLLLCTPVGFVIGIPSGIWLGRRIARAHAGAVAWLLAVIIASLVASLGSIGLGVGGVVGVCIGLFVGGAVTIATSRARLA